MVIVFNSSLSHRHEGDFVAVLICTSLMSNDVEHHFICLFAIPASSLVFLQIFRPFSLLVFLDVGFWVFFVYFGYKYFSQMCDLQIFSPSLWLVFSFFKSAFWWTIQFNTDKVQDIPFFLLAIMLFVLNLRTLPNHKVTKIFFNVFLWKFKTFTFYI